MSELSGTSTPLTSVLSKDDDQQQAPRRQGRYAGTNLRPPISSTHFDNTKTMSTAITNTKALAKSTSAASHRRAPVRRYTPVPKALLEDPELLSDMRALPDNYSLEVAKTVHRAREVGAVRVALQMPEGLLLYATTLSDIIRRHAPTVRTTVILGDVTYGACCVDDLAARALNCDLLVHYGHSCLVPVSQSCVPTLYVFVHIAFDMSHLARAMRANFAREDRIALVGTIQFVDAVHKLKEQLCPEHFDFLSVPQKRPLSPGELLGCTAPVLPGGRPSSSRSNGACGEGNCNAGKTGSGCCASEEHDEGEDPDSVDILLYVGDGRFHLESAMIANPRLKAFRYDPYSKTLTRETYAHDEMRAARERAIGLARDVNNFGVVLGTLGRQGSPAILRRLLQALRDAEKKYFVVLLSELSPAKLKRLERGAVHAWVQIACPRLSIDWGQNFSDRPLLTPYECLVTLGKVKWKDVYPMDFYAKDGGEWTNYYKDEKNKSK